MVVQTTALLVWGILFLMFVLVETFTVQLVSIWCGAGSVGAIVASLLGASFQIQILVFTLVSVILILCTRPLVKKMQKNKLIATNADALIGQQAIVTEDIENIAGTGRVKVGGQSWAAKCEIDEKIPCGTVVNIHSIEGVKLIVSRKEESL